mmetsp:Transcript_21158/g.58713  ORF Transcript_21158/g.58713 Transcript_21158/m.58713 type:complete len:243 (+) Transcript_21158:363-1091(+)
MLHRVSDRGVHLCLCAEPPKPEADGGVRHLLVHPEGAQYIAGLQAGRGAGRTAGHRNILQAHQQRLPLDVRKGEVAVSNVSVGRVLRAVEHNSLKLRHDSVAKALLQARHVRMVDLHLPLGDLAGGPEPHHKRGGHGPGAQAALLPATVDLRLQPHARAAAEVKRSHPLGAIYLVPADRHGIDVHLVDVHRHLTHGLRRVCVEEDFFGAAQVSDLLQRLQNTDLVIDRHDGDQSSLGAHGCL